MAINNTFILISISELGNHKTRNYTGSLISTDYKPSFA